MFYEGLTQSRGLDYTWGMAKNKKRPQAPKTKIDNIGRAEVERARSNAAGPHRKATDYRRKPKHFKGWE